MNYVPKPDGHNHNISHEHPLQEFLRIAFVFAMVVLFLFALAGRTSDFIVTHLTPHQEALLMHRTQFSKLYKSNPGPAALYIQSLVEKLHSHEQDLKYNYAVLISCETVPNAYALPGGIIVVTAGLAKAVKSENGLSFVLAHELGHFHNKDHLKSMGRQFLFTIVGSILGISKMDSVVPFMVDLSFSREQEQRADLYGFSLLREEYGHIDGSGEFFEYLLKEYPTQSRIPGFISSHPGTGDRLQDMQNLLRIEGRHELVKLKVGADWSNECQHSI